MAAATAEPVLILGGGLMGLAIAHQLARRGHPVEVLSRRRSEAAGFVAAGMLAPHAEGLRGPLLALGQALHVLRARDIDAADVVGEVDAILEGEGFLFAARHFR